MCARCLCSRTVSVDSSLIDSVRMREVLPIGRELRN